MDNPNAVIGKLAIRDDGRICIWAHASEKNEALIKEKIREASQHHITFGSALKEAAPKQLANLLTSNDSVITLTTHGNANLEKFKSSLEEQITLERKERFKLTQPNAIDTTEAFKLTQDNAIDVTPALLATAANAALEIERATDPTHPGKASSTTAPSRS